jgi:hypothetical protein
MAEKLHERTYERFHELKLCPKVRMALRSASLVKGGSVTSHRGGKEEVARLSPMLARKPGGGHIFSMVRMEVASRVCM